MKLNLSYFSDQFLKIFKYPTHTKIFTHTLTLLNETQEKKNQNHPYFTYSNSSLIQKNIHFPDKNAHPSTEAACDVSLSSK